MTRTQSHSRKGPKPLPVEVRGQRFNSPAECAAHFGVSVNTVYSALHRGRPDSIGAGFARPRQYETNFGRRDKVLDLPGCKGLNQEQASISLGLRPDYITVAIMRAKRGYPFMWERVMRLAMERGAQSAQRRIRERDAKLARYANGVAA